MQKGLGFVETWMLGIQDKSHPLLQVLNRFYGQRAFEYNKERDVLTNEYKRRLSKVMKKTAIHIGVSYKDIYAFLWNKREGNEDNMVKGGEYLTTWKDGKWDTLTAEQKDFANYHRWTLRYHLFATMNPQQGIAFINKELQDRKDLTEDDRALLEGQITSLSDMPDINKFKLDNLSNYYREGWTPRVQRQPEEAKNIVEHIKNIAKNTWKLSPDDLVSTYGDKLTQGYIGMPIRYMGGSNSASEQEEKYTYNPEVILASFADTALKKRYFDDVHNLSIAIKYIIEDLNNVKDSKKLSYLNTYVKEFAKQLAGQKANEFHANAKRIIAVKNAVSFTALALRILAPLRTGIGQELQVLTRSVAGEIAKLLSNRMGIDRRNIDTSFSHVGRITRNIVKYQKDLVFTKKGLERNKTHFFNNIMGNTVESYSFSSFDKGKMSSTMSFFLGKKIDSNGLYFMYRIWDIILYSQYMEQQMMNIKVPTKDGKGTMSMYDAYQYNENTHTFEYQGGIRGRTKDGTIISGLTAEEVMSIKKVSRDTVGGMRTEERGIAENSLLGMLFLQFKWFFPGMLNAAWKKKQKNATLMKWMSGNEYFISDEKRKDYNTNFNRYEADGKTETALYKELRRKNVAILPVLHAQYFNDEGYFRILFTAAMLLKLRIKNKSKFDIQWEQLSDYQKQSIILAMTKIAMYLGIYFLMNMAFGGSGGDDDKDFLQDKGNKWAYNFKTLRDQYMFEFVLTDIPGITNTLQSVATINTTANFLEGLTTFGGAIFTSNRYITSGVHEGWIKGTPKIIKNIPVTSTVYDAWRTKWDYQEVEDNWLKGK